MKTHIARSIFLPLLLLLLLITPTTSALAGPNPQEGEAVYIVQSGDSLSSIAVRFGVDAAELQTVNGIADANALAIGQRLVIPGLDGVSGVLTTEVVPFGISLAAMAREYQIAPETLTQLNKITSPSEAVAGVDFIIAANEGQDPLTPLAMATSGQTTLEAAILSNNSPWLLAKDNQLAGSWDLFAGDMLYGTPEDEAAPEIAFSAASINVNPLPVLQGETLEIGVSGAPGTNFTGSFNGEPLTFFSDDGSQFYSFHGIHAQAEPGIFPLSVTATTPDGQTQTFEQMVLLADVPYTSEFVYVSTGLQQSEIDEEKNFLDQTLATPSSERYWDGVFQYPVDEPCLGSTFGLDRNYNDGQLYYYHTGLDFRVCAPNLNIYAPAAGRVIVAEALPIKGNAIIIDHGWGVYSGFAHLSAFNVEVGAMVQPGDLIGQIGDTGRSAGPHLHFEINIGSTPVNPMTWLEEVYP
jgi:murein DD-endopeptidase MepM/ murein hydrolase activator NlpD